MISTQTRLRYANGYLELGMLDYASVELEAIPSSDRLTHDVIALRSRFFLEANDWNALEDEARLLTENYPHDPYGWVNWAYALREQELTQEAKVVAAQALKLHPKEAILWFNLACYCSLLGELPVASKHLDQAIALDPAFKEEGATDPDLRDLRLWRDAQS